MPHLSLLRKNSFKRLFSVSISRRSAEEETPKQDGSLLHENIKALDIFPVTEQCQKPTWKCFSYEEIFEATNGFQKGEEDPLPNLIKAFIFSLIVLKK